MSALWNAYPAITWILVHSLSCSNYRQTDIRQNVKPDQGEPKTIGWSLNIKTPFQYRYAHDKGKTVLRQSYLYHENSNARKEGFHIESGQPSEQPTQEFDSDNLVDSVDAKEWIWHYLSYWIFPFHDKPQICSGQTHEWELIELIGSCEIWQ